MTLKMTPHEHYREAEKLSNQAQDLSHQSSALINRAIDRGVGIAADDVKVITNSLQVLLARAQLHATLATVNQDHHQYWVEQEEWAASRKEAQSEVEPL